MFMRPARHVFLLWFVLGLFYSGSAFADEKVQVSKDVQVVYCSVAWPVDSQHIREMLKSGIALSVIWHLSVQRSRRYWLDEHVASITVVRRVIPDLLSHRWTLEDQAAGIARQVPSLDAAVRFLTHLDRYPVVDRSLLQRGERYTLDVTLQSYEGTSMEKWWNRILQADDFSASVYFQEP